MNSSATSKSDISRVEEEPDGPLLFEPKIIAQKGRGLVARQSIPQGTLIIHEKPLLVAEPRKPDALEALLASELRGLDKLSQRKFLSLHNNFPGKHPFGGIMKTNALPCGSGSNIGAVYPTICLINHSCLPNTQHTWNSDTETETIFASRPISCGEEITIAYDRGGPSAVRQDFLKRHFGFQCTCVLCSRPPRLLQESDKRRSKIAQLDSQIGDPFRMMNSPAESIKDCHSMLQLLMAEYDGYPGSLAARLYYDAFQISIAHGDQARASVFAGRAYEVRLMCEGGNTPEAKMAETLAADPATHSTFMAYSSKWRTKKNEILREVDKDAFDCWLFRISH